MQASPRDNYDMFIDIDIHDNNTIKRDFCTWLDYIMYYQAMWVLKLPNGKYRQPLINIIGITFTICSVLIDAYFLYHDHNLQSGILLPIIDTIVTWISITSARAIAIYYLIYQFNYPWHDFILRVSNNAFRSHMETYIDESIQSLRQRISIYLLFSYSVYIIHWATLLSDLMKNGKVYEVITDEMISLFGIYIPFFVFQVVISVTYFKYQVRLYYLQYSFNDKVAQKTPNFVVILKEYQVFAQEFENDTYQWKRYVLFMFIQSVASLWYFVDTVEQSGYLSKEQNFFLPTLWKNVLENWMVWIYFISGFCAYISIFVEYCTAAAKLNDGYDELERSLWQYDTARKCVGDDDEKLQDEPSLSYSPSGNPTRIVTTKRQSSNVMSLSQQLFAKFGSHIKGGNKGLDLEQLSLVIFNIKDFHFLLQYISKNPIVIKLWGVRVTRFTPLKFLFVFVIARFVSYMFNFVTD